MLSPSMFSLLNLPRLALQNVADLWNPYEIFNFSMISKKSKQTARQVSRKARKVGLDDCAYLRVLICLSSSGSDRVLYSIIPCEPCECERQPGFFYGTFFNIAKTMTFPLEKYNFTMVTLTDHVMEVFKCSEIHLNINYVPCREERTLWIKWAMDSPFPVKSLAVKFDHDKDDDVFFENFDKPVDRLELIYMNDCESRWNKPKKVLKVNRFLLTVVQPVCFGIIEYIDAVTMDVHGWISSQDLNSFIKSWQSGSANNRMKSACFQLNEPIKFEKVLDGIKLHQRDPRTVKRAVKPHEDSHWIAGGIDIQREDGLFATILWENYKIDEENSDVDVMLIEEFEKIRIIGEEESSSNLINALNASESTIFSIYVW